MSKDEDTKTKQNSLIQWIQSKYNGLVGRDRMKTAKWNKIINVRKCQLTLFSNFSLTFSGLTSLVKRRGFPAGSDATERNEEEREIEPRLLRLE